MSSPLRYHDSWYSSEPVTLQDSETWLPTLPFTFLGLTATFRSSGGIGGVRMLLYCLIVLVHVLFKLCLDQMNHFCLIPSMMEPNNQTLRTFYSPFTSTLPTTSAVPYPFHTSHTYVPVSLGWARSISRPVTLCRKRVSGSRGLLSFSQRYLGAGWPDALHGNSTRCDAITSRRSKLSRIWGAEFAGSVGRKFGVVNKINVKLNSGEPKIAQLIT